MPGGQAFDICTPLRCSRGLLELGVKVPHVLICTTVDWMKRQNKTKVEATKP